MTKSRASTAGVGPLLREWRTARGKSQLALAVEAGVSTRHLSFVETGRSTPSREMVLTLAAHLDLPLRERNALLQAAGYAAVFRETPLEAEAMKEVRRALTHLLEASHPNPSLVVNRRYDILLANSAAVELFCFFAPAWKGKNNMAHMIFAESGLRSAIADWPAAAGYLVKRLRAELANSADAQDIELLAIVKTVEAELAPLGSPQTAASTPLQNVLVPVTLRRAAVEVDIFTAITTLGTPLDITLQELRIETFFPADTQSRDALAKVVAGGASSV